MPENKRERDRRKRAELRKKKARLQAEQVQVEARRWKSYDAAEQAEGHLQRGEFTEALREAARAASLNPGDADIAQLYVAAAQSADDLVEQARAVEHLIRCLPPDARLLINLAYLQLQTGETERAQQTAVRARALFPGRMKDRKHWLGLLQYVEAHTARAEAKPRRAQRELPLAPGKPGPDRKPGRPAKSAAATPPGPVAEVAPPAPETAILLEVAVEIARDVDGLDVLFSAEFSSPDEVLLATLAATIRDAESWQTLFAVERARGLLRFSHQEDTARKVLSVFLGRALLADEVGLGKTIEAGLILSEYLQRGHVDRALVLTPPTLVGQWREELASKFAIETRTPEDPVFKTDAAGFWSGSGVVIASLATARSGRQREFVTAQPWDLVIIDEAHALKNAATESYRLAARITSRFLLLLTATPVENRIEELYNLVNLIRPGHLGGRSAFLKRFSDSRMRLSETARTEVRALLGEVMVRNTRALSGVQLPPRFARTVLVQPDPAEAELYDHLAAALRALGAAGSTRLLLSVLLQEAGSSPFAVRATLEKLRANADLSSELQEALLPAIQCAERSVTTGKAASLLRVLEGASEPAIVFTRFRATLDFLADVLGRAAITHEKIDGNVPAPLRHEAIARVRQNGGVLLSTEVGAEGLNLQFCRRIVNFDLPWNPAKIEQRIGRVHRIGQDHPVEVVNFCLAGSIEERILMILDERINLFELVVGETEMILGYLDDEREFPDLMLDAFAEPNAEGRERSFTKIADALAAARTRYENVKRFDEAFFRNELGA